MGTEFLISPLPRRSWRARSFGGKSLYEKIYITEFISRDSPFDRNPCGGLP